MAKYRRAPSGEWLGYPRLALDDIEYDSFRFAKYTSESLVENRKGRVYLLMESDFYTRFLDAVRKKFGDIAASSVEKAAREAVERWVAEVSSE